MRTEKQIRRKLAMVTKALDELEAVELKDRSRRWYHSKRRFMGLLEALLWANGTPWPNYSNVAHARQVVRSCK